jgi:hypothetical protein
MLSDNLPQTFAMLHKHLYPFPSWGHYLTDHIIAVSLFTFPNLLSD